jgi:Holliday junction resolvase RusA-like endonuclease
MTFRFIRPTRGRIDIDNLSTGVTKAVLDSLVRGGWLVDDDSTHVVAVTAEAVYERGRRALVVVMEEAA